MQFMLRTAGVFFCSLLMFASPLQAQDEPVVAASEKPQHLNRFGIVVENSGLSRLALERSVKVLASLLKSDLGASEAFLVSYADSDKIRLRVDFTSDKFELIDAVENLYAESGSGAFLDAVKLAADHLNAAKEASEPGLLLILSSGYDKDSRTKADDLVKLLAGSKIRPVIVGISEGKLEPKLIDRLIKDTSGKKLTPLPGDDPAAIAETLRMEVVR